MAHLKGLGVKNFRVFENETYFNFSKINILTGPNNSGKSSLFKLCMFLSGNNLNELNISKGNHSLGEVDSFLNYNSLNDNLIVSFIIESVSFKFKVYLTYKKKNDHILTLSDMVIKDIDGDEIINSSGLCRFNFVKLYSMFQQIYDNVAKNYDKRQENSSDIEIERLLSYNFNEKIFEYSDDLNIKSQHTELEFLSKNFCFPEESELLNNMLYEFDDVHAIPPEMKINIMPLYEYYFQLVKNSPESPKCHLFAEKNLNLIENYNFLKYTYLGKIKNNDNSNLFFAIIRVVISQIINDIKKSFYQLFSFSQLRAVKGPQERFYNIRNSDEDFVRLMSGFKAHNFNQQDHRKDLIGILTGKDRVYKHDLAKEICSTFIYTWFREFGIGDDFKIEEKEGVLLFPYIVEKNKKVNLSDLGYGYSQILAIILKIIDSFIFTPDSLWEEAEYIKLYLEEPEENLHPNFQSKLADMIVYASKIFKIQFLIETHSEYLIRKLQYLTAKKEIKPEDTVIYYFNHPKEVEKGAEQVKEIKILEDGSLSDDFGPGFFDEATNLKFDLLRLKNPQKN